MFLQTEVADGASHLVTMQGIASAPQRAATFLTAATAGELLP